VQTKVQTRAIELATANAFVKALHRHHPKALSHRFSIGAVAEGTLVGVAIIGRPVARMVDPTTTLEVTRLCTNGHPNACSALYGAAARVGKELGYHKIQTYVLAEEAGTSLKASGWEIDGQVNGRSWSCPSRPRVDAHPTTAKVRWAKTLAPLIHFEIPASVKELASGQIGLSLGE
jgi:hypothetical protein